MTHPMRTFSRLILPVAVAGLLLLVVVAGLRAGGPNVRLSPAHPSVDQPRPTPASSLNVDPTLGPDDANGALTVAILIDGQWQMVGQPSFNEVPSEQRLDLGNFPAGVPLQVRISHGGDTAAHLDTILLDGQAPVDVSGQSESESLALRKLAAANHDLIDIAGRSLEFTFAPSPSPTAGSQLSLVARIEPPRISQIPFQFPPANNYQAMSADSAFYTYRWGRNPGQFTLDGSLDSENMGQPFLRQWTQPGTGHPDAYAFGWVRNDADTLYVALEFGSDNTLDGDKDYAKVYVNTATGLEMYKVSVPEQTWGQPGFDYSPRIAYQHKIYEFALPLSDLGLTDLSPGDPLSLAFALYGTAALPNEFPGLFDASFGASGVVTTDVSLYGQQINDLAVQSDGKIVAAGEALLASGDQGFALARYTSDGSLDATFGASGIITTSFVGNSAQARALILQPADGKIVVAGGSGNDPILTRYTATGGLDPNFGTGGIVTSTVSGTATWYDVALQNDGKLVAVGFLDGVNSDFLVARFSTTGTLDADFGASGIITTDLGGSDVAYGVAIQSDGKIVVGGKNSSDFALARYTISGTLDAAFGNNGVTTTHFSGVDAAYGLALQADGKIVLAGVANNNDFAVARYTSSGALDTTFAGDGATTTDFGSSDQGQAVAVQDDGKIVVVGYTSGQRLSVARYNADGSLDDTFGTSGRANDPLGSSNHDEGHAVAIQPDDQKIIAAGLDGKFFLLVRYALSPSCFATIDGTTIYSSTDASAVQTAVDTSASDDTIKVAGTCAGVQQTAGISQTVYISQNLTLRGGYTTTDWATSDPVANPTTLDAQSLGRVVFITGTVDVTIENLTVTGGRATKGGGIWVDSAAALTLNSSQVLSNTATGDIPDGGGGLGNLGHTVISNTIFSYNNAGSAGGVGNGSNGVLTVENSTFSFNSATIAGALGNTGRVTVTASTFVSNSSSGAGAIGNLQGLGGPGWMLVQSSNFLTNTAGGKNGGAIDNDGGQMHIVDTTFQGNSGKHGGVIYNNSTGSGLAPSLWITASTFLSNTASSSGNGGALRNRTGTATVLSSTFSYNRSTFGDGGAIQNQSILSLTAVTLTHNSANINGGGVLNQGVLTTTDSNLSNNSAPDGGGIYNRSGAGLTIEGNTFSYNSVSNRGGGIYNAGTLTVGDTTFAHNPAQEWGGGLYNDSNGTATISTSTFFRLLQRNNHPESICG